ncbi:hypothetical protein TNCV_3056781 [Trichonephila clavipes]|nr:hypothetical protein TNCV_3056781 [Trichonephila clavipes]
MSKESSLGASQLAKSDDRLPCTGLGLPPYTINTHSVKKAAVGQTGWGIMGACICVGVKGLKTSVGMDVCKVPMRHGGTLKAASSRKSSREVGGGGRWVGPLTPFQGVLSKLVVEPRQIVLLSA